MAKWFQSFPYPIPESRSYVHWGNGAVERVAVEHGAYGLAIKRMWQRAQGEPGLWMIEWDIALGLDDMEALEAAARWKPELLHVCSYALHWRSQPIDHRVMQWNSPVATVEQAGEAVVHSTKSILNCDYPGLGVIWFPAHILELMESENRWQALQYPDADATFWRWVGKDKMNVVHDVHPVHLHW